MEIKVQKLNQEQLNQMGVFDWPVWTKGVSKFPWSYDSIEECYFLEGDVTIEVKEAKAVSFGKGDFVTFPKGLECTWNIKVPVRKHYNFK
ncbi:MAG: cupin domain-containing protein [Candidatus Omnitrophica bacterium]|nr:cupin domain-containing protein [Candidatus Omnitrophota bacterium]MBU1922915.1 cupin domain-containing protein [Candidatus Omnitrophota bacterium]